MRRHGGRSLQFCGWCASIVVVGLLAAGFGGGCKGGKVTCSTLISVAETVSWKGCSDNKERQVQCAPTTGEGDKMPYACTCIEGGVAGKSFAMADIAILRKLSPPTPRADIQASYDVINQQCGWALGPN